MQQPREEFVEPEIIKHEEKMADLTRVGSPTAGDDIGVDGVPGPS
jgi:hypothetical protein